MLAFISGTKFDANDVILSAPIKILQFKLLKRQKLWPWNCATINLQCKQLWMMPPLYYKRKPLCLFLVEKISSLQIWTVYDFGYLGFCIASFFTSRKHWIRVWSIRQKIYTLAYVDLLSINVGLSDERFQCALDKLVSGVRNEFLSESIFQSRKFDYQGFFISWKLLSSFQ